MTPTAPFISHAALPAISMRLIILLLTLAVLAEPAAAQPFIRVRDVVTGELAAKDSVLPDGSRYDTYRFHARPGSVYYVYLFARFEGRLDVGSRLGPGCGAACVRAEDDGEPGSTVEMQFIPDRPGTHLVRVVASRGGEAGLYQLTLESQEVPEEVADSLWPGADTLGLPVDSLPDPAIYGAPLDTGVVTTQEYLGVGETVAGELTDDDPTLPDGEHYDVWRFQARARAIYVITLESGDFDAYLRVGPPDGTDCDPCEEDDDNGPGTGAQLVIEARATEAYVIRATSFEAGETGTYSLKVQELVVPDVPVVVPTEDTLMVVPVPRDLVPGVEYEGSLDDQDEVAADGAYEDTWVLRASAGEPVTITLRSDDFDTVLRVGWRTQGRWEELAYDDDGGDGTNSEVVFTPPRDGEYLVLASSFDAGEEGAYTIVASTPSGGTSVAPPARTPTRIRRR